MNTTAITWSLAPHSTFPVLMEMVLTTGTRMIMAISMIISTGLSSIMKSKIRATIIAASPNRASNLKILSS